MSTISEFTTASPSQYSGLEPTTQIDTKFTFAASATTPTYVTDDYLDLVSTAPFALITSDGWVAADITFKMLPLYSQNIPDDPDHGIANLATMYDESDTGTEYTLATQDGAGFYRLPPSLFNCVSKLAITSSNAQTNGATVYVVAQPIFVGR